MTHSATTKITLVFLIISLSLQLFSQTGEIGIIKGKIIDKIPSHKDKTTELPGVSVFIELDSENMIGTQTDTDGNFEFSAPAGNHTLTIKYISYQDYYKEVTVKPNDTLELEIPICNGDTNCRPWENSIPYPELGGFWKPVSYFDGNTEIDQSKRRDKAGLSVYFINDTLPGKLTWNNGCSDYYFESLANNEYPPHFRNLGNGIIEIHNRGNRMYKQILLIYTYGPKPLKCNNTNKAWEAFMSNIHEKKFITSITNEGQLLSLSYGDEKIMLRKIHNYSQPEFSTELLGNWSPVEGKLNGKKMEKFANKATIIFDRNNIQYKEKKDCANEIILNYRYLDKDYISIKSLKWPEHDAKYRPDSFSQYGGCHLQFNETKNVVTLKYNDDYLVLKRKE